MWIAHRVSLDRTTARIIKPSIHNHDAAATWAHSMRSDKADNCSGRLGTIFPGTLDGRRVSSVNRESPLCAPPAPDKQRYKDDISKRPI